jgi:hypothetical protein
MVRALVIRTHRVLAFCWILSPCVLLMCMRNGPQVRQDLLPAARGFLLVTARAHRPATSSPPQQITSTTTSPINCFAPVEYWQNNQSPGCRLQFVGAEKPLTEISYALHRKTQAPDPTPTTPYRQDAMRFVSFFKTELPRTAPPRGGRGGPSCSQTGQRPPWRQEKKNRRPPRASPAVTPETAKSPRDRVPTCSGVDSRPGAGPTAHDHSACFMYYWHAPRSSGYAVYLRHTTAFESLLCCIVLRIAWWGEVLLLRGSHQEMAGAVLTGFRSAAHQQRQLVSASDM